MATPFKPPKATINKEELIRLAKEQNAAKAAAMAQNAANENNDPGLVRRTSLIKPENATDKLRIIFDNSGSMEGIKIQNAKEGVVEFLRNCTPNATAVAIHLLNNTGKSQWDDRDLIRLALPSNIENTTLSSDLILLASEIIHDSVDAVGGTPLYARIEDALKAIPLASRLVVFSDGCPDSRGNRDSILRSAKSKGIPIDTVYTEEPNSYADSSAIAEMKYIAEMTGGIFLDLSKGSIKDGLKYLAPTKRLMLMDASFKAKLEKGEIK